MLFRAIIITATAALLVVPTGTQTRPHEPETVSLISLATLAPMVHSVDCEGAQPPGLRVVYGPGGGPTECFGGTGPESIGQWVQGIATTSHSGVVLIQESGRCSVTPFGPNNFLRIDAVVCAIHIDSE